MCGNVMPPLPPMPAGVIYPTMDFGRGMLCEECMAKLTAPLRGAYEALADTLLYGEAKTHTSASHTHSTGPAPSASHNHSARPAVSYPAWSAQERDALLTTINAALLKKELDTALAKKRKP
jgi:hypothetical protein